MYEKIKETWSKRVIISIILSLVASYLVRFEKTVDWVESVPHKFEVISKFDGSKVRKSKLYENYYLQVKSVETGYIKELSVTPITFGSSNVGDIVHFKMSTSDINNSYHSMAYKISILTSIVLLIFWVLGLLLSYIPE